MQSNRRDFRVGHSWAFAKRASMKSRRSPSLDVFAIASAVASGLLLAAVLNLSVIGSSKPGRILINEHNSNWEGVEEPYSAAWFGSRVGYNYYLLRRLLECRYSVRINKEPLTPASLSQVDVLFLKTPTAPYAESEIAAVAAFVRAG